MKGQLYIKHSTQWKWETSELRNIPNHAQNNVMEYLETKEGAREREKKKN
jgi:hypothetical protein